MPDRTVTACGSCGRRNRVPAAARGVPRCAQCHTPLPWMADGGDSDFATVVGQSPVPVLVDLWAPWCGPCRTVSPVLERLAGQYAGRLKLVKVNVDQSPQLSARFGVRSIPTLLLMQRGEAVARQIGAAPEPALRTWLDQGLARVVPSPSPQS